MVSVYNKLRDKFLEAAKGYEITLSLTKGRKIIINEPRISYSDSMITIYDIDKFPMGVLELIAEKYNDFIQEIEKGAELEKKKEEERKDNRKKIEEKLEEKLNS